MLFQPFARSSPVFGGSEVFLAVRPTELAAVPEGAVESFAGIANPWSLGRLEPGERVLDLGSGAGTDSLIAARMVGPEGSVTGMDMTTEMLEKARATAAELGADNVTFVEGESSGSHLLTGAGSRVRKALGVARVRTDRERRSRRDLRGNPFLLPKPGPSER